MRTLHAGALVLGTLVTVLVLAPAQVAAQPQVERATDAEKHEAKASYVAGKEAFGASDYEVALMAFKNSYAAVASPNTLLMIARSLTQLRRYAEACRVYEATLEEAEASAGPSKPKWKNAAKAALEEQTELLSRVGLVSVRVLGDRLVTLSVNGQVVPEDQWERPVPAEPGRVEVALDNGADGRASKWVQVAAGELVTLEIGIDAQADANAEATPASEAAQDDDSSGTPLGIAPKTWRTTGYVATGIGVVGVGLFAAFGAMSQATYDDLEKACPTKRDCDPALADDIDTGASQQTIANVSLVVGGIALAAGVAALWIGISNDDSALAFGPGGVELRGSL